MIHYIDEEKNLEGKKVLLRLDLNVPMTDAGIEDEFRIERVIRTIDFLRTQKAQTIIITHAENKEGEAVSLVPIWHYLNGFFPVEFSPTYFTPEAIAKLTDMQDGGVLLFENVRTNPGEKKNDPLFAQKLAQMADIYVNDAFAVSHRPHASIVGVPNLLSHYGGLLLRDEIENLSKAFVPKRPFLFILGGAKFETKLPIIQKYLAHADHIFVSGALANNFFKEQGFEIGTSLVSSGDFGIKEMLADTNLVAKLILPTDVTVVRLDKSMSFKKPQDVLSDECIMDVGPQTIIEIKKYIDDAQTVVWNGTMGNYEAGFGDKTESLAEIISESDAATVIGGGDTLAAISKLHILEKFTFVSTGGGAMLDFLVNETLVGIEALK